MNYATIKYDDDADIAVNVWRSFYYFNYYRIILAGFFVLSYFFHFEIRILGSHDPLLFATVSLLYLATGLASSIAIHWRWPGFHPLLYILVFADITALTLLMHASGGLDSGLGMLLIVAIAGNSLLTEGRTALLFAALAALAILTQQTYSQITGDVETNYTQAGTLGITLFATAIFAHILSRRLQETQELAVQRGIDLANLAQLNEHVIKRMQSGIVVVDAHHTIRLMNESAWHLLGLPAMKEAPNKNLANISPELLTRLKDWQKNETREEKIFHSISSGKEIIPSFTRLGSDPFSGILIFLEDASRLAQQAQQIKLASLGRLTASIAHEIRNPLGAISHAEQLLAESDHLDKADTRLTEIIHTNCERVNAIVENVLQLSRRGNASPEIITLEDWLEKFLLDFSMGNHINSQELSIDVEPRDITVFFDNTQLHQIVWNLCQNGIRYSKNNPSSPKVELIARRNTQSNRIFLDIIDHGPGISPEVAQNIFEPFFTTNEKGSGLGLYIARELCEANQARLIYIPVPSGGSCFRIEFSAAHID